MARFTTLAVAVTLAIPAVALAAPPSVTINFDVDGNLFVANPTGTGTFGVYNFAGSTTGFVTDYHAGWNFNATNSVESGPLEFLSGNFTFTNLTGSAQVYDVLVTLATTPDGPSSLVGGSVAGGLTGDAGGGSFATIGSAPVWTAFVGATQVGALLSGPFSVLAPAFGSTPIGSGAFGTPIPSQVGPALGTSLSINFQFELGAGDQASFTSVFVLNVVPAPSALALLGLAGFVGRRRR